VINLHYYFTPFPRYSFRKVQNRYIWLPLLRLAPFPDGGFPWDDLHKISPVNGWLRCQMA